jgi:hypothetical protein
VVVVVLEAVALEQQEVAAHFYQMELLVLPIQAAAAAVHYQMEVLA